MRIPDPAELVTRAVVAIAVAIAVLQVIAAVVHAAGPYLVPLALLALAAWLIRTFRWDQ